MSGCFGLAVLGFCIRVWAGLVCSWLNAALLSTSSRSWWFFFFLFPLFCLRRRVLLGKAACDNYTGGALDALIWDRSGCLC